MHERHAFGLERLAEMSGKLVEQAYHRAIIAEAPEEKDRASLVFDRLARGFRLTLALEARFARDVRREDREIADHGAEPAASNLPRPVAAPRPERPAREPTEADHESEMEAEETSDALAVRVKDLSHILEDHADMLDPDGSQRVDLDALAEWWAIGQRYEPGYQPPKPTPRRAKAQRTRPPRPRVTQSRDIADDDVLDEDIPDEDDIDDEDDFDDEPLWLDSG